uniref:Uncharacterized protein n=1 Tax=Rhizophora mucronata TaxID=61149 RepID=A0A2P2QJ24_RHIMU
MCCFFFLAHCIVLFTCGESNHPLTSISWEI